MVFVFLDTALEKQQQQQQSSLEKAKWICFILFQFIFVKKLPLLLNIHKNSTGIVLSLAIGKILLSAMKIVWCDTIKC